VHRGDVYLVSLQLPNRTSSPSRYESRDKLVVILQGGPDFASVTDVAVAVASSRRGDRPVRSFEVLAGQNEGFQHESLIDCRWPYTLPKSQVQGGRFLFTLPADTMRMVSLALVRGLQMS